MSSSKLFPDPKEVFVQIGELGVQGAWSHIDYSGGNTLYAYYTTKNGQLVVYPTPLTSVHMSGLLGNCGIAGCQGLGTGYWDTLFKNESTKKDLQKLWLEIIEGHIAIKGYRVIMANDGDGRRVDRYLQEFGKGWERQDFGMNYNYAGTDQHHVINWYLILDEKVKEQKKKRYYEIFAS